MHFLRNILDLTTTVQAYYAEVQERKKRFIKSKTFKNNSYLARL